PLWRASSQSAEGAQCNSLGQRPRNQSIIETKKPQRGEMISAQFIQFHRDYFASSELNALYFRQPGALPQAISCRAFGAFVLAAVAVSISRGFSFAEHLITARICA